MTVQDKLYIVIMLIIGVAILALNYKIFVKEVNPVIWQWIKDHKTLTLIGAAVIVGAILALAFRGCVCG